MNMQIGFLICVLLASGSLFKPTYVHASAPPDLIEPIDAPDEAKPPQEPEKNKEPEPDEIDEKDFEGPEWSKPPELIKDKNTQKRKEGGTFEMKVRRVPPKAEIRPPRSKPDPTHKRDKWYIGFGLGSGPGQLSTGGAMQSYKSFFGADSGGLGASLTFSLGGTVRHNLLLGFRGGGMGFGTQKEDITRTMTHNHSLGVMTFFPSVSGTGFFVRTGIGFSELRDKTTDGESSHETKFGGFGSMVGLGYAFWLGETFNLCLSNDVHYGVFQGSEEQNQPTAAWYSDLQLSFMWY